MEVMIPAKGKSSRVPNKNVRKFAGSSLLEIKIDQLKGARGVSRVYVSSDDDTVLNTAVAMGCVALYRSPDYCSDQVSMSDVYSHLASGMIENEVMLVHVTNPLASSETYERCILAYADCKNVYDSMTTVSSVKKFLFKDGKAMNFDPAAKPRSQDLPNIVSLTHVASIYSRNRVVAEKRWAGDNPLLVELSELESYDIDTELDFEIAEYLYMKHFKR